MNWFGIAASIISRLPLEHWLIKPKDNSQSIKGLEDMMRASESQNKAVIVNNPRVGSVDSKKPSETPIEAPVVIDTINPPSNANKAQAIATGCVPCSIGHLATCSGLLNEAMRFAKKDGIASEEVLDRLNMCLDELNALERVDLRSELIVNLPGWEKELANKALTCSRDLRHKLEGLSGVDDLEQVVATTQTTRNDIGRQWYQYRLTNEE